MKNETTNPPAVQCAAGSNTGDSSVASKRPSVVENPKLRAVRSIALLVGALGDGMALYAPNLSEVECERLSSLVGGIYDVLEDAAGVPAERSEAERGSLKERPTTHELIEALAADVNATQAALDNMRAAFRRVADQRDTAHAALRIARAALQTDCDWWSGVGQSTPAAAREAAEALKVVKTALDPAPKEKGRDEAPPAPAFDASEYERPRKPPKVIVLGPVEVAEVTR